MTRPATIPTNINHDAAAIAHLIESITKNRKTGNGPALRRLVAAGGHVDLTGAPVPAVPTPTEARRVLKTGAVAPWIAEWLERITTPGAHAPRNQYERDRTRGPYDAARGGWQAGTPGAAEAWALYSRWWHVGRAHRDNADRPDRDRYARTEFEWAATSPARQGYSDGYNGRPLADEPTFPTAADLDELASLHRHAHAQWVGQLDTAA